LKIAFGCDAPVNPMPCHLGKQAILLGAAGGFSRQIEITRVSLIATRMLRRKLEQMTADTRVDQHEAMLADISRTCPNTIRVLRSPYPHHRYTCIMHAFDFTERPEYVAVAKLDVWAGADFAHWLVDGRLSPVASAKARARDLVFYLPEGRFKVSVGTRLRCAPQADRDLYSLIVA
jgi:hypothetical protein